MAIVSGAAIAMAQYVDSAVAMRPVAFCAIKTAWIPFVGRFFLRLLDAEVERVCKLWPAAVQAAREAADLANDPEFYDYALAEGRKSIDAEWPEPRTIRLPSDLEPVHGRGDC